MFKQEIYIARREALRSRMNSRGVVLLPGNELSPNSYPSNCYYFRQDATFRYFFGSDRASLCGIIDLDSGEDILFGDDGSLDDIIWTGIQPTIREIAAESGVSKSDTTKKLFDYIAEAQRLGRTIHILPPYRGESKIMLSALLSISVHELQEHLSPDLIFAVAELREQKGEEEIAALEAAFEIGYEMHTQAMRMVAPGVVEREIGGQLEGIARRMGAGVSFPPICTQHGETLHNIEREGVLQSGRLFLCDAGGESLEGYCSDHTRTYPINGKFTDIQRDIYNVALSAYENVKSIAHSGMLYTELQAATYRKLGEGLRELGFFTGSMEQIIESNAVSLFMPHGVSHSLGLDVHDCEAMGERTFDVERYREYAARSTSGIIRKSWVLKEGCVMSNEPGIYFIPDLIKKSQNEGKYKGVVNYEKVLRHFDFGGIRIEDDILIIKGGCRQIGSNRIPVTTSELEDYISLSR